MTNRLFLILCFLLTLFSCKEHHLTSNFYVEKGRDSTQNQIEKPTKKDSSKLAYPAFLDSLKPRKHHIPKDSINQTKALLIHLFKQELPTYWLGTAWDFNGTTEQPGVGHIACGYFVSTVLRDIGWPGVRRIYHAQQPSSVMINALCHPIKRIAGYQRTIDYLKNVDGDQLYIVGLDLHTGFIIKEKDELYFFHANFMGTSDVQMEKLETSANFRTSENFMLGSLSKHESALKKWINPMKKTALNNIFLFHFLVMACLLMLQCYDSKLKVTEPQEIKVGLFPLNLQNNIWTDSIAVAINNIYGFQVQKEKAGSLPQSFFSNIKSPRYRADSIIRYVEKQGKHLDLALAITSEDICVDKRDKNGQIKKPENKYKDWGIFGLGFVGRCGSVVSGKRLKHHDPKVFFTRLQKVAIHELGHNLGLSHCPNKKCVMTSAVEKISTVDQAALDLCKLCRGKL